MSKNSMPDIVTTDADSTEVVRRMMREKLLEQNVSSDDIEHVIEYRQDHVQQALEYFRQYKDFRVSWVPGDGDGYGDHADALGGIVIGYLFVYQP